MSDLYIGARPWLLIVPCLLLGCAEEPGSSPADPAPAPLEKASPETRESLRPAIFSDAEEAGPAQSTGAPEENEGNGVPTEAAGPSPPDRETTGGIGTIDDGPPDDAPEDRVGPDGVGSGGGAAVEGEAPDVTIEIDRERGEIRFPCRFVNPTRQIEVLACHKTGPAHETVVEFDVTGEQLYRAMLEIGCRPSDYWNATSPSDFLRNQGDRVFVLLRWTWEGKERELPAEALLADGDSGFPSFIRGFSFSAFDVDAMGRRLNRERTRGEQGEGQSPDPGDPADGDEGADADRDGDGDGDPDRDDRKDGDEAEDEGESDGTEPETGDDAPIRIPVAVEITLGAAQRQRAVFSLLSHPTTLDGRPGARGAPPTRSLQFWSAEPTVAASVIPDLRGVVETQPPATLIFRRLKSEVDVIQQARAIAKTRGVENRRDLYEHLEPVAREIDTLKALYEKHVEEIRTLLDTDLATFFGDSGRELEHRGGMLRRRGQWLCARIQELYFGMYLEQERFKLADLRRRGEVEEETLFRVQGKVENGLRYEVEIATRERLREETALKSLILTQEIWALELERQEKSIEAELRGIARRLELMQPGEAYLRQLFLEERRKWKIALAAVGWRRALNDDLVSEAGALLDDNLAAREKSLATRRQTALQGLKTAKHAHEWLRVAGALVDGTRYQLAVVDSVARKEKSKRKYTKVKERIRSQILLQLRLRPRHGDAQPVAAALKALAPPRPLSLAGVDAKGQVLQARLASAICTRTKGRYRPTVRGESNLVTGDMLLQTLIWAYDGIGRSLARTA